MYPTATRSRAVVQAFYIPPQRPGFAGNPAINRTSIGNASAHAAAGAALAGPPGAVLGALYGAAGPGPSVVKIAAATALGAMAFGPVGAALGAFATANPHHTMKASMAGVAGAYFANPWMAGLGAAFLGK